MITPDDAIEMIRARFNKTGSPAFVQNLIGETFTAWIRSEGVEVDNLNETNKMISWRAFEAAVVVMNQQGGSADKGNAQGGKLGSDKLSLNSIEGYVAQQVYGIQEGDSVFRRITPLAGILIWSGVCENLPGSLKVKSVEVN